MEKSDIELLVKWLEENKDHRMGFLEKEAVKLAVSRANTVEDLVKTALKLLKK